MAMRSRRILRSVAGSHPDNPMRTEISTRSMLSEAFATPITTPVLVAMSLRLPPASRAGSGADLRIARATPRI